MTSIGYERVPERIAHRLVVLAYRCHHGNGITVYLFDDELDQDPKDDSLKAASDSKHSGAYHSTNEALDD